MTSHAQPVRVLVAGPPGAGKSSWAQRISAALHLPYVELDSLFHGPNWTPRETFIDDVKALADGERWVIEWQYTLARPILADRATTLLWLDLPVRTVMWQLTRRTVSRRVRREKLWADNLEMPLWRIVVEPNHIIRWGWRTRNLTAERVQDLQRTHPHITVARVHSHAEAQVWLDGMSFPA